MSERTCSIDGCGQKHYAKGWCNLHWNRHRRNGDPFVASRRQPLPAVCKIDGCDRPRVCRGWCRPHYNRWRTHGDPHAGGPFRPLQSAPAEARFWAKVDKNGPVPADRPDLGPCWLWTASTNDGYPYFGKEGWAHRWSYRYHVGPIPDGHEVDHLCFVRSCVNPAHLEAVTHAENMRRMNARAA